jgi:DNA-binding transcriptional MocR family regulator
MILELNRESLVPLYAQIVLKIREMITSGSLKIGDRLPANRDLARRLGVNRTTVTTAYADLVADGLITSHVGRGTFVSGVPPRDRTPRPEQRHVPAVQWDTLLVPETRDRWLGSMWRFQPNKESISLGHALPQAELFPLDEFRRSIDRVLRREGRSLLQLGASNGYEPLLDYIASQMSLVGVQVKPGEILITNGCQQSLDLIRRVLVGPGEEVVVENPTYPGALSLFCGRDAKYISVPIDAQGLDLDALEDIMVQRRPKLIYTVPSFHNPTGLTMNLASRRRLAEMVARLRVPMIEDDIYGELRFEGASLPPIKAMDSSGLVLYINSFSKMGFPGLRLGWIVAPGVVIERLNDAKVRCDLHTSTLAQAAVYEFSRQGLFARHLRRVRKAYAARRDAMLQALDEHLSDIATWTRPEGGMSIWVRLPEQVNAAELLPQAAEAGVLFTPGDRFYSSLPKQNMMRLCFTMAAPDRIGEGIKRLAELIRQRVEAAFSRGAASRAEAGRALV